MEASSSQGRVGGRSVQQQRRPTRVERNNSIRLLRKYTPHNSELPQDARNEPLNIRQSIFATLLLEELGIVVENGHQALNWLSVVVVLDGESLDIVGVDIRVTEDHGTFVYYFSLEDVAIWPRRTRMLLFGNEFNRIHFAHLEHHVSDGSEGSDDLGDYNRQEYGQEVEEGVQVEQEVEQGVQLEQEAEPQQDVQLQDEVEQQFVQQSTTQDVQLQHEVEQLQFDNDNGGVIVDIDGEVVMLDIIGNVIMEDVNGNVVMVDSYGNRVLVDEDGDVVMVGVGEGVVGEGVNVQPPQVEHGYPLGHGRGHIEFQRGRHRGRGRVGCRGRRDRRGRGRFH